MPDKQQLRQSPIGTENSINTVSDTNRNSVCECSAAGWCSRRDTRVSSLHFRKCSAGHVDHVDSLIGRIHESSRPSPIQHAVRSSNPAPPPPQNDNLLSTRLKKHIEEATGTEITCGVCRAYLRSLDVMKVLNHDAIAKTLAIDVQMSDRFKEKHGLKKHLKRVEWMSTLIEPLIPKNVITGVPPATIKPDNPPMTFVWPYWHAGSRGDELRFSMRSVLQHYGDAASLLVVGDRPPWYSGPVLHQDRIRPIQNVEYCDMVAKMKTLSVHRDAPSQAIWMMDDIYFVNPVSLEELQTPRAYVWDRSTGSRWRKLKKRTMDLLRRRNLTTHDYATHLPHWYEKDKLRTLWDRLPLDREPLLWEVAYGNIYRGTPIAPVPFLRRVMAKDALSPQTLLSSPVFNNADEVWCQLLREMLQMRFPHASRFERDEWKDDPA